ncbi:MAG: hypothetical protein GX571_00915 [Lentisphaerae bacterium]|nr:hypothetical protein [Lentisphaerota bacterium]
MHDFNETERRELIRRITVVDRMAAILCNRYGNEKALLLSKGDFVAKRRR